MITGLSAVAVAETARSIAAVQSPSGQIPWFADGPTDPWDHIEAAMALDVAGRHAEAEAAYEWLRRTQNSDGSWCRMYHHEDVTEPVREANFTAYLGVGLLHHVSLTGDDAFAEHMWPTLVSACEFVLRLQAPGGEIAWAPDTTEALLTGCSSIYHSLRCALVLAERRGEPQPDWELAATTLGHAIVAHPDRFSPRERYSMDWYYPVLGGALRGPAAHARLTDGWERFVVSGLGVRCVADRPWVTGAETSELVLALCALGSVESAAELFAWTQHLRADDGSYWTGYVYPDDARWPEERTTWTAGAMLLASAVLTGEPVTTSVFGLPALDLSTACDDDVCAAQHA